MIHRLAVSVVVSMFRNLSAGTNDDFDRVYFFSFSDT